MTRVAVDPAALARWSADAADTARRLDGALTTLDAVVGPLAVGWDGEAAEHFDRHVARWRGAADRLLATLGDLRGLVDIAHDNYTAAITANARTWRATPAPDTAVITAMSALAPARRIDVELDDLRTAVVELRVLGEQLARGWTTLADTLAGTAAMTGYDDLGVEFGRRYDGMAGAAWQGWRASAIMLTAICGGLAETGNKILDAERRSQPGAPEPAWIDAVPPPVPAPPAPPGAGGTAAPALVGVLAEYWPTADVEVLRGAATAWNAGAAALTGCAGRASAVVRSLVDANPDPVLARVHEFTAHALADDPNTGLCGVLAVHCRQVAAACEELAAVTERTRTAIVEAVAAVSDEWYHPVATLLDATLTRGLAKVAAAGGDATLIVLALDRIRQQHEDAVRPILTSVDPAAADRLARVANAIDPPVPVPALMCQVPSIEPAGLTSAVETERQRLIAEILPRDSRTVPAEVLHIERLPDGRIVWLGRGGDGAGMAHLLRAHRIGEFAKVGVDPAEVATFPFRVLREGRPIGRRATGDGVAYEIIVRGRSVPVMVVVSENGFIVTAYPIGKREVRKLVPIEAGR